MLRLLVALAALGPRILAFRVGASAVVRAYATVAGALGLLGCSEPQPAFSAPHEYGLRGTTVLAVGPAGATCGVSSNDEGALSVQQPPTAPAEMSAFIEANEAGNFTLADTGGCVISVQADEELSRLTAREATCLLAEDSTLSVLGVTARTYRQLELDFMAKRWLHVLSTQQVDGAGVTYDSCGVGEGWIVDASATEVPTSPGPGLQRYSGTYAWFAEQPEDGPVCEFMQGEWETEGHLRLEPSSDGGLEVYEAGVGCSLTAQSDDGVTFVADAVPCTWPGPVSLRDLGVVERSFDSWRYDSETGELLASGRLIRQTDDGERLLSCFTLDLLVDDVEH